MCPCRSGNVMNLTGKATGMVETEINRTLYEAVCDVQICRTRLSVTNFCMLSFVKYCYCFYDEITEITLVLACLSWCL